MRHYIFLLTLLLGWGGLSAQTITVKGTVTDASTGETLIGASVIVIRSDSDASTSGTVTDFDGSYVIENVPAGSSLRFSYTGFETTEREIGTSGIVDVALGADVQALEEVVVIGYGTQQKRNVTGSVVTVDNETIDDLRPVKIEQALQGTVAGVNVTTQSGAPGAGLNIRIRGVSTNGQNAPLVIIDGYQGDLSTVNPTDIASITVLKDAQAAVYGTVGANGVILVTTKTGNKNSPTQVSYNTFFGIQETSKTLNMLNATEYGLLLNESYAAGGQALPYPDASTLGRGTDWQNEVFGTAPMLSHDVTVSGGSDRTTYSISGSHLNQEGIIGGEKSNFTRNTARLSLGVDLSDKLKLTTNAIFTNIDRDALSENGLGAVLFNALNAPPTLPVFDETGEPSLVPNTPGLGIEVINPVAQIANTFNDYDLNKLNGQVSLDWKALPGLTLTSRVGFNTSNSEGRTFSKLINYGGKVFDVTRSSVSQNAINDNNYSLDLFGTYQRTLADKHNFTATAGTTVFRELGNGLFATGFDVPNNDWEFADISLATGTSPEGARDVGSYSYDERRLSYFGRVQYDFQERYFLTAMLRRDASTKFGPENRAAFFPSFTAGWIASDESFFGDEGPVDLLKFRVSYGILGNDQIINNGYIGTLSGEATYVFDGILVNGTAIGALPNPSLQWEEAKKFNVGFDLALLDYKLNITADYFINTRDNLLISNIPVSGIVGTSAPGGAAPTVNAGAVQNKGLELAISYQQRFNKDWKLNVSYNLTTLNNEVLEVNNGTGFIEGGAFGVGQLAPSRMEVGQPIGYFFGYQTDGIFQNASEIEAHPSQIALGADAQPGDIRFVDTNNDGVIDPNDRTNIGDPIADMTMGFNFQLEYKRFDLLTYAFASLGGDIVRNYERALSDVNRLDYYLDRWTGAGTSSEVPRVTTAATANGVFSDFFVEDASFLRLQSVQLGYTLPFKAGAKRSSSLRLYVSGNNLLTLSNYKGFDPGASSGAPIGGGIDYGFYPIARTILFGANLTL
ncbi:SusC/RagA family TonB-linked outer membrane protein [Neolewinella agarilytica]|uniref:TonB-linked outer membrane protein, SusC/RagA family n=1 Tax=Neolewinella agarilytica TaxID=478744 RepID=A0A1H9IZA1_9BACT|nr:TonB-dependent receptor [Neolewinella agarilytica]SEQ79923.1 TonB-linked outer membrane protein, SusC/RagA family [Neolewinella agarilytica]